MEHMNSRGDSVFCRPLDGGARLEVTVQDAPSARRPAVRGCFDVSDDAQQSNAGQKPLPANAVMPEHVVEKGLVAGRRRSPPDKPQLEGRCGPQGIEAG